MLKYGLIGLVLAGVATPAAAQEMRRQLGAHSHGEGRLALAIEGNKLQMELEVPASDILGFEHAPKSAGETAALTDAKARLAQLTGLFALAPEAGCKLTSADVDVEGAAAGGHDHEHEHDKTDGAKKDDDHHHEHGSHSEFHVTYDIECASPGKLGTMAFDYFKSFPGAQKLDVTVIGPKGQSSYVVTREKPVLDLSGVS